MLKSKIETISFDCGGTLFYETKEDHIIYKEILNDLGISIDADKVKEALQYAGEWWNEKAKKGEVWTEDTWTELLKRVIAKLELPNPNELIAKILELRPKRAALKAYEDAEPTLKALKQRRMKMIAVSNVSSEGNLRMYLDIVGLTGYFDFLVASGSVGYEKPNPEIFRLAARLAETPIQNMIHVGDKYEEDCRGPESAGMKAILIDRKGVYSDKNCKRITKLMELFAYLDKF